MWLQTGSKDIKPYLLNLCYNGYILISWHMKPYDGINFLLSVHIYTGGGQDKQIKSNLLAINWVTVAIWLRVMKKTSQWNSFG